MLSDSKDKSFVHSSTENTEGVTEQQKNNKTFSPFFQSVLESSRQHCMNVPKMEICRHGRKFIKDNAAEDNVWWNGNMKEVAKKIPINLCVPSHAQRLFSSVPSHAGRQFSDDSDWPPVISDGIEIVNTFPDLTYCIKYGRNARETILFITRRHWGDSQRIINFFPASITLEVTGTVHYSLLFGETTSMRCFTSELLFDKKSFSAVLNDLSTNSCRRFCTGVKDNLTKYLMKFHKNVTHFTTPYERYQSRNCLIFYVSSQKKNVWESGTCPWCQMINKILKARADKVKSQDNTGNQDSNKISMQKNDLPMLTVESHLKNMEVKEDIKYLIENQKLTKIIEHYEKLLKENGIEFMNMVE